MKINTIKSVLLLAAVTIGVSACSSQSNEKQSWWYSSKNVDYLTPDSADKVKYAQAGEELTVVDIASKAYEMQVKERYFSASGKDCLTAQTTQNTLVVCEYGDNRWGISRNFGQRPQQGALQ
jgi:hypothetical protein